MRIRRATLDSGVVFQAGHPLPDDAENPCRIRSMHLEYAKVFDKDLEATATAEAVWVEVEDSTKFGEIVIYALPPLVAPDAIKALWEKDPAFESEWWSRKTGEAKWALEIRVTLDSPGLAQAQMMRRYNDVLEDSEAACRTQDDAENRARAEVRKAAAEAAKARDDASPASGKGNGSKPKPISGTA